MPLDQVTQKMRADIYLLPRMPKVFTSQQFELQFSYPDPRLAQQVNALLVSHLFDPKSAKDWLPPPSVSRTLAISLVSFPSLPAKPVGISRLQQSMIGFALGLLGGILTAKMLHLLGHAP